MFEVMGSPAIFLVLQMTVVKSWVAGDMREMEDVKALNPKVFSAVIDGIGLNTVGDVFLPEVRGVTYTRQLLFIC